MWGNYYNDGMNIWHTVHLFAVNVVYIHANVTIFQASYNIPFNRLILLFSKDRVKPVPVRMTCLVAGNLK
jgi:hypothetical protein